MCVGAGNFCHHVLHFLSVIVQLISDQWHCPAIPIEVAAKWFQSNPYSSSTGNFCNFCCFNHMISWQCIYHNCLAIMTCAKLWSDLIICYSNNNTKLYKIWILSSLTPCEMWHQWPGTSSVQVKGIMPGVTIQSELVNLPKCIAVPF